MFSSHSIWLTCYANQLKVKFWASMPKKAPLITVHAYFHVYQINNGFNIYNNFKNLIVEVLHDIISNGRHFCQIQNGAWPPSWICFITATPDEHKNVTIVLSMVENPHLDILHGHSNRFLCQWLICPNSTQNCAFEPLYRAKWPPWGYFCTW